MPRCGTRYVGLRPLDMQGSTSLALLDMCRFAARCGVPQAPFCTPGPKCSFTQSPYTHRASNLVVTMAGCHRHLFVRPCGIAGCRRHRAARPLVWSGKTNSLFLGGIAARKARPLLESGNIDSLFLGGSTAGQRAHSYGVGKMIDLSCDKFMSICLPSANSIYGLSAIRYAALRAARYVPLRGTLWGATGTFLYARAKVFFHSKSVHAPGFQSRRDDDGVPQAPLYTPVPIVFSSQNLSSHRTFDLVAPTPGVYRRWTQSWFCGEQNHGWKRVNQKRIAFLREKNRCRAFP